MAGTKKEPSGKKQKRPAMSPEAQEQRLISLAVDLAEEQLSNKTASAQVITHFLKLATAKANLEKEKLKRENELLKAKTETLQSQKNSEELYKQALDAMRSYSGLPSEDYDE